jgi:hypothetical protein
MFQIHIKQSLKEFKNCLVISLLKIKMLFTIKVITITTYDNIFIFETYFFLILQTILFNLMMFSRHVYAFIRKPE